MPFEKRRPLATIAQSGRIRIDFNVREGARPAPGRRWKTPCGPSALALTLLGWWTLGRMSKLPIGTPPVPDEVLRQLAKLARVSAEERENFYDLVCGTVQIVWDWDRRATATKPGRALARAGQAARTLHDALGNLNNLDRQWLEVLLERTIHGHWMDGGLAGLQRSAYHVTYFLSDALGQSPPDRNPPSHRRGRKTGGVKDLRFQEFVRNILIDANLTGGSLTLQKNIARGTLIGAIKTLAPTYLMALCRSPCRSRPFNELSVGSVRST
jgi:hypothetical protein